MSALPSKRVTVSRRWLGKPPDDIPRKHWPKKRRHCWQVRWWLVGPDGKPKSPSKSFATKDEAAAFAHEKRAEYADGAARREPTRLTLGEFIEEYRTQRTGSKGQRIRYASAMEGVFALQRLASHIGEETRLADISKPQVIGFVRALESDGTLAANTIGKTARMLKACLSSAVAMGFLRVNPVLGLPCGFTRGPIRYVTPAELDAILTVAKREPDALWWETFLMTLYTTGLRLGEASALAWSDIDFERGEVSVSAKQDTTETLAWSPKTTSSLRSVPVPDAVMALLARLQERADAGQTYVFVSPKRFEAVKAARDAGENVERVVLLRGCQSRFPDLVRVAAKAERSLLDREGKPSVTLHDLRRSCITNWTSTIPMQAVSQLAGHSSIVTTARFYASTTTEQRDGARAAAEAAIDSLTQPTSAKLAQTTPKSDKATAATVTLSERKGR